MNLRLLTSSVVFAMAATSSAARAPAWAHPASGFLPGLAFAESSAPGGGFQYVRIEFGTGEYSVGPLSSYFFSGGFVDNDFTHEYAIAYPAGNLYAIDTTDASTALIGSLDLGSGHSIPSGPRWDPVSRESYLMAPDASCGGSTLYTLDTSTAAVSLVGTSDGTCIVAIAIDLDGTMYGYDLVAAQLMLIDKTNGAAQPIGGFNIPLGRVFAMDFDPSNDILYAIAQANDGHTYLYEVDPAGGNAAALGTQDGVFGPFAFALENGLIFTNGFESP